MSEPVTAEEMETWAAVKQNYAENITARYLRAGAAAIRDRDAGWQAADALAGALEQMAPVGLSDQARTALASYRAAEAARNPNPEGRT